ncbi:MAG TPA: DUF4326 domain-containing protein [Rhizomicrobium sp.]|nr:DUF4326 domain-containing protein [Rhizomicrobium sp.]
MTKPVRLQLSRKRGFNLQELSRAINGLPAVNVTRRGRWGNPFVVHHPGSEIGRPMSAKVAVASFKSMVEKEGAWFPVPLPWPKGKIPAQLTTVEDVKQNLRGKNLACVCHLCEVHKRSGLPLGTECADCAPCHSTVLLEIANG